MAATSHTRGHEISWDGRRWAYSNGESAMCERPCTKCGRMPTPEGHDACLGAIKGAVSACCGHGVTKESILMFGR